MISDSLKKTRAKYQTELDILIAKRDEEINAKCEEFRNQLLAEPNHEIEAMQSLINSLNELIAKEEQQEIKEEVVEQPIKVEEIAIYEKVDEETKGDEVVEENACEEEVKEESIKEEVVEEKVEDDIIAEKVEEPKKPKFSFFVRKEKVEVVKEEPIVEEKAEEQKDGDKTSKPIARPGMINVFNPKRR